MDTTVVTTKGQIVIPAKLRKKYGIKAGTKICFLEQNDTIIIRPITDKYIDNLRGMTKTKGEVLKMILSDKERP